MEVVISLIARSTQRIQVGAGLLHLRSAAVLKTQGDVGMGAIGPWDGEPQVFQQQAADVKDGIVGTADGSTPCGLRVTCDQGSGQRQKVALVHEVVHRPYVKRWTCV